MIQFTLHCCNVFVVDWLSLDQDVDQKAQREPCVQRNSSFAMTPISIMTPVVCLPPFFSFRLSPWSDWMVFLTRLGSPVTASTFLFPVFYGISSTLGLRVLWAAALSEWTNLILKW